MRISQWSRTSAQKKLPLELAEEVHVQADRFSIAFRQMLREVGASFYAK